MQRALRTLLRKCVPPALQLPRASDVRIRALLTSDEHMKVLDVGSGTWRRAPGIVKLDVIAYPMVDVVGDAQELPFGGKTFDLVICSSVLEHLLSPERVIAEVHRVLRPGGKLFVEIPFLYPFHGDELSGEGDYWRMTLAGLRHALRSFSEVESGRSIGPASIMSLLAAEFLALFFSLRRHTAPYYAVRNLLSWALFPLRLLDPWLSRRPFSFRIAGGFYFLGLKGDGEPAPAGPASAARNL